MAEKSAGRVLLIPKGVFTIGTNYTPLDFVAFGSSNYVCKSPTDGTKTPVEDTASWQMLAAGFDSHNIAAEYSEEATYHTGDICISGGNLYKAKQDINVAEAFTAGHWEAITIGQELMSLETSKADARKLRLTFPASGWSESAPYTQTINDLDVTKTDTPERWFDFPDPVPEGFDYGKYTEETGFVTYCETGDGLITAVCRTDKPTMDLVIVFKGC